MTEKTPFPHRFMNVMEHLRMFFSPADQDSLNDPIKYDDPSYRQRQKELQQWDIVRNADGSTYLVKRREDNI